MRRREFFGFAGGAASAWAVNAFAQQMYRVAVLTPSHTQWQPRTFRDAMQELGYREDINLNLTVVSGENQLDRMPKLAADLVASAPDVIVAVNTPGTRAAIAATSKIPIVSAIVADPVFLGFVANIARPEANVTGVANMAADITSKRIALLKEVVPSARRFALLTHPDEPIVALQMQDIERSAPALGIEYRAFPMRTAEDLQRNLQLAVEWNAQAVVRLAGQGFALGSETGRLATERGLPSMLLQKRDVEAGGLMSYFADHRELWRRIAAHVDRLLKGASPRELPFELPTRFELFVNLKTARALGITLSPLLIARADEVIE
jgi:putative tryptophan/tyrosine transport system substrate-binding protein